MPPKLLGKLGKKYTRASAFILIFQICRSCLPNFKFIPMGLLQLLCNESIQFTTGQLYRHKESFCSRLTLPCSVLPYSHTQREIMIHGIKKTHPYLLQTCMVIRKTKTLEAVSIPLFKNVMLTYRCKN